MMHPEPKDNRNLMIALLLSSMILMGWHFLYEAPRQKQLAATQQQERLAREQAEAAAQAENAALAPQLSSTDTAPAGKTQTPPPLTSTAKLTREQALAEAPRITITSGELHGSLSLKGARFDDLTLARYREALDKDSPEVKLLSPSRTTGAYFAELGWLAVTPGVVTPDANSLWQSTDTRLTPKNPVILYWDSPQGIRFEMEVAMDEHYMFAVTQRVINRSENAIALAPYGIVNRSFQPDGTQNFILHEGLIGLKEEGLHEVDYKKLKEEGAQTIADTHGWLGITDKYWLTAIIPEKGRFKANYQYFSRGGEDRYQTDLVAGTIKVTPGASATYGSRFFAGAKEVWLLDKYSETLGIPLFDRAVDFGSLYFLTKPIFLMLDYFNGLLGNFGLAILLLTVVIKGLMFPLANKSYASMAHLKEVTPKMQEIRERHADDKVKMNQEIIALYKKEGVNPASGCLPMLIQIPVFFSLYKVLYVTIEMRHAPFFGWIQDLSAKDPTNVFTLFGLIDWTAPSFLHIGVWPLIMTATMILQQSLNPKPADPMQAQVIKTMPFVFLFLFANFPAGLVIYWAWNNTLSILQQWTITKRASKKATRKLKKAA